MPGGNKFSHPSYVDRIRRRPRDVLSQGQHAGAAIETAKAMYCVQHASFVGMVMKRGEPCSLTKAPSRASSIR